MVCAAWTYLSPASSPTVVTPRACLSAAPLLHQVVDADGRRLSQARRGIYGCRHRGGRSVAPPSAQVGRAVALCVCTKGGPHRSYERHSAFSLVSIRATRRSATDTVDESGTGCSSKHLEADTSVLT